MGKGRDFDRLKSEIPEVKYLATLQQGFFIEEWECLIKRDWLGGYYLYEDGEESHTHHFEFKCADGTFISETGYRSHFVMYHNNDFDVAQAVKEIVEGRLEEQGCEDIYINSIEEDK